MRNQTSCGDRAHRVFDGGRLTAAVAVLEADELVGEHAPPLDLGHARVEPHDVYAVHGSRCCGVRAGPDNDDMAQRAQCPPRVEHVTKIGP